MKYVPYIIIAVLVGVILFDSREVDIREIHTTDTVTVFKIDTFIKERPVVKYKRIVDTMYIEQDGKKIELPIESRHYSENGIYDAWVSGYNPSLDSIRTYNKTEYRTITDILERNVYERKWNLYGECGFYSFSDTFSPYVGISITSPKRLKIGGYLGIGGESISYGLNVGIKLNK